MAIAKRKMRLLSAALVIIMALSACNSGGGGAGSSSGSDSPQSSATEIPKQQLTIGTASAGGAYYPIGTGVAEVISQHVGPLNVTAEITGGSIENPRLVGENDVDLGMSNANQVVDAFKGLAPFEKAYDVRAICSLHASVLHIVTVEKTGIKSIADLKGKKVAVGPAGGASAPVIEAILAVYGMTMDDITPSYVSYDDGMSQLKDGQVSAALAMSGYPAASVLSLGATDKVVLIPIESAKMAEILKAHSYYSEVVLGPDVYNTSSSASLVAVRNIVYCNPGLSDDTVYAITKALYENLDELKTFHSSLEEVEQGTMLDVAGLPMHPGAERYYKEAGLLK